MTYDGKKDNFLSSLLCPIISYIKLESNFPCLSNAENHPSEKPIAMGIILGVVIPIIAIIALLAICIIRRQRKNKPPEGAIPELLKDHEQDEEELIGMNSVTIKAEMNGQIANGGEWEESGSSLLPAVQ